MGGERDLRRFVMNASAEFTGPNDEAYDIARRLLDADPGIAAASEHAALVLGDVGRVRAFLEDDPSRIDSPGGPYTDRRPLHYVTYSRFWRRDDETARGLLECARLLLDAGADPDATYTPLDGGERRLSALLGACGCAHFPEMARLLLARGASPDDGESLYHSLEFPGLDCFEILLEAGAATAGTNALNHSMDFPDPRGTRRLLECGADPDEQTEFNGAPLHWAVSRGREVDRLRLLVDAGADPVLARRRDDRTPYAVAAQTAHLAAADWLESIGAATELRPIDAFTYACARNDLATARALVARRPDLFAHLSPADVQGVHQLAERGRVEALAAALDAGLPVDVANGAGQTPLHWAAWHGQADVVELLLRRGAALETVEREFGCTPLLWAAHGATNWPAPDGDYPRVVRLLLDAGADVTPTNAWGEGAVSLAGDARDVATLLRDAGAPDPPPRSGEGC